MRDLREDIDRLLAAEEAPSAAGLWEPGTGPAARFDDDDDLEDEDDEDEDEDDEEDEGLDE